MPTVLITGAGRGLGLELARQYAADGWRMIGTERSAKAKYRLDVTDHKQIAQLARQLKGEAIDVLFCNAGIYGPRGMELGKLDFKAWEEVLRVNLLGPAALAEALVENVAMSERKVIAMMSSRMGSIAEASGSSFLYATSKAALNALAKGLSVTLAPRGIIVVAMSPGWVRTDMGGESAPLAPESSVAGLRKVIEALKREDAGRFLAHDGSTVPW